MIFATGFWDCQTGWCPDVTSLRLLDTSRLVPRRSSFLPLERVIWRPWFLFSTDIFQILCDFKTWVSQRPGWSDIRILSQGVIEGPCFGVASVECFPRHYGSEITGVSSRWFCGEVEYCPRGFEPAALILNAIDRVRPTKVALVVSVCKTDPESSILW